MSLGAYLKLQTVNCKLSPCPASYRWARPLSTGGLVQGCLGKQCGRSHHSNRRGSDQVFNAEHTHGNRPARVWTRRCRHQGMGGAASCSRDAAPAGMLWHAPARGTRDICLFGAQVAGAERWRARVRAHHKARPRYCFTKSSKPARSWPVHVGAIPTKFLTNWAWG